MKKLIESIVPKIIEYLFGLVPPAKLVKVADKLLDWCEEAVKRSDNELDDTLLVPFINLVREAFHIPDEDVEGPKPLAPSIQS